MNEQIAQAIANVRSIKLPSKPRQRDQLLEDAYSNMEAEFKLLITFVNSREKRFQTLKPEDNDNPEKISETLRLIEEQKNKYIKSVQLYKSQHKKWTKHHTYNKILLLNKQISALELPSNPQKNELDGVYGDLQSKFEKAKKTLEKTTVKELLSKSFEEVKQISLNSFKKTEKELIKNLEEYREAVEGYEKTLESQASLDTEAQTNVEQQTSSVEETKTPIMNEQANVVSPAVSDAASIANPTPVEAEASVAAEAAVTTQTSTTTKAAETAKPSQKKEYTLKHVTTKKKILYDRFNDLVSQNSEIKDLLQPYLDKAREIVSVDHSIAKETKRSPVEAEKTKAATETNATKDQGLFDSFLSSVSSTAEGWINQAASNLQALTNQAVTAETPDEAAQIIAHRKDNQVLMKLFKEAHEIVSANEKLQVLTTATENFDTLYREELEKLSANPLLQDIAHGYSETLNAVNPEQRFSPMEALNVVTEHLTSLLTEETEHSEKPQTTSQKRSPKEQIEEAITNQTTIQWILRNKILEMTNFNQYGDELSKTDELKKSYENLLEKMKNDSILKTHHEAYKTVLDACLSSQINPNSIGVDNIQKAIEMQSHINTVLRDKLPEMKNMIPLEKEALELSKANQRLQALRTSHEKLNRSYNQELTKMDKYPLLRDMVQGYRQTQETMTLEQNFSPMGALNTVRETVVSFANELTGETEKSPSLSPKKSTKEQIEESIANQEKINQDLQEILDEIRECNKVAQGMDSIIHERKELKKDYEHKLAEMSDYPLLHGEREAFQKTLENSIPTESFVNDTLSSLFDSYKEGQAPSVNPATSAKAQVEQIVANQQAINDNLKTKITEMAEYNERGKKLTQILSETDLIKKQYEDALGVMKEHPHLRDAHSTFQHQLEGLIPSNHDHESKNTSSEIMDFSSINLFREKSKVTNKPILPVDKMHSPSEQLNQAIDYQSSINTNLLKIIEEMKKMTKVGMMLNQRDELISSRNDYFKARGAQIQALFKQDMHPSIKEQLRELAEHCKPYEPKELNIFAIDEETVQKEMDDINVKAEHLDTVILRPVDMLNLVSERFPEMLKLPLWQTVLLVHAGQTKKLDQLNEILKKDPKSVETMLNALFDDIALNIDPKDINQQAMEFLNPKASKDDRKYFSSLIEHKDFLDFLDSTNSKHESAEKVISQVNNVEEKLSEKIADLPTKLLFSITPQKYNEFKAKILRQVATPRNTGGRQLEDNLFDTIQDYFHNKNDQYSFDNLIREAIRTAPSTVADRSKKDSRLNTRSINETDANAALQNSYDEIPKKERGEWLQGTLNELNERNAALQNSYDEMPDKWFEFEDAEDEVVKEEAFLEGLIGDEEIAVPDEEIAMPDEEIAMPDEETSLTMITKSITKAFSNEYCKTNIVPGLNQLHKKNPDQLPNIARAIELMQDAITQERQKNKSPEFHRKCDEFQKRALLELTKPNSLQNKVDGLKACAKSVFKSTRWEKIGDLILNILLSPLVLVKSIAEENFSTLKILRSDSRSNRERLLEQIGIKEEPEKAPEPDKNPPITFTKL